MTGHRLLIVEDHQVLSEALAMVISERADYAEVVVAESLRAARAQLGRRFDRAVLDVRLPDGDGNTLIPDLVAQPGGCRVLVLTAHPHPLVVARATAAGAEQVLPKGTGISTLLAALDGTALDGAELDRPTGEPTATDRLTEREVQVIELLTAGYDVRQAARRLQISHYTVRDHLKSIYAKLGVASQLDAVLALHRAGVIEVDRVTG